MDAVTSHLGVFGQGLLVSAEITAATFALAFVLGVLLACGQISPVVPLRIATRLYVAAFRSVPLLALLTLFVFGLPFIGLKYSLIWTAITAMSLYWAAFVCTAVCSGVRAVPAGEIEAARALGLRFALTMRLVIIPRSLRTMVQPMASLLIAVTLNSALAAAVGVTQELTGQTELLDQQYAQPLLIFGAAAVCYVALTLTIGWSASRVERRVMVR